VTIFHVWLKESYELISIFRPPCTITISSPYLIDNSMWWNKMHILPATMGYQVANSIVCKPIFSGILKVPQYFVLLLLTCLAKALAPSVKVEHLDYAAKEMKREELILVGKVLLQSFPQYSQNPAVSEYHHNSDLKAHQPKK